MHVTSIVVRKDVNPVPSESIETNYTNSNYAQAYFSLLQGAG